MGTNQATPEHMRTLAAALSDRGGDAESWGNAAAGLCQNHGYWYAATAIAGSAAGSARWADTWSTSLVDRADLLDQYDAIAVLGAGAAGGAGAALGAARTWALTSPEADFAVWYQLTVGAALARQQQVQIGQRLAADWRGDFLDDGAGLVSRLTNLSPEAAAAFLIALGQDEVVEILSLITPPLNDPYLVPSGFDEAFAAALGCAWDSGELDDAWKATFIGTTYDWSFLFYAGQLGSMGSEYWGMMAARIVGDGPRTDYARNPTNSLYTHGSTIWPLKELLESDPAAAAAFAQSSDLWMHRGVENQYELEEWIDDLLRRELGAMSDEVYVETVAGMLLTAASFGGDIDTYALDIMLMDAVVDRPLSAEARTYLNGALVKAAGSGGVPEALVAVLGDRIAEDFDLVLDALAGFDHLAVGLFPHPGGDAPLQLDEAAVEGALRLVAENEESMARLMENLELYFATRIARVDGSASLVQLGRDLGVVSGALITAINRANISSAKDADERRAAVVGLVGILVAAVPVPGLGLAGTGLQGAGKRIISATYGDLESRGLDLLSSSNESAARIEADEFKEMFVDEMHAFLIVGSLSASGTLASSIDEFAGLHPELSKFTLGDAIRAQTPGERHAFNEYLQWVLANDTDLNLAILGLAAEFSGEIPSWGD